MAEFLKSEDDPFGDCECGMVAIPVVDLKAMEVRIRQNIRNAERRLTLRFGTMIFLATVAMAALMKFLISP